MTTSIANDPVLRALNAEWEAKNAEIDQIIGDHNAKGDRIKRAESLFEECKGLKARIEERTADVGRISGLKEGVAGLRGWADQPNRTLPFSASMGGGSKSYGGDGAGQFRYGGSEPAGSQTIAFDPQAQRWQMVAEAGAGLVNQDRKAVWDLLSSFEYKRDFAMYLRKGLKQIDLCQKTLQEGLDDQGGVFAPAEFIARIIGRLPAPTSLRGLVTTLTTGRDLMILPRKQYSDSTDQYTTAFRVNWTGEIPADGTGAQAAVDDTKLTGNVEVPIHTAMLNGSFTRNMIEDSAFPLQAWLEGEFAQTIDLLYEDKILNGTGTGQPEGILLNASNATSSSNQYPEVILSSTAGGIDYGQLIDLQTALAPQYENESTRWVMNKKSTYRAINKLLDAQNRPLFTTGYEDSGLVGRRGRVLLGDEITLSQFAPSIASTAFPLVYGDLKGYYLGQRVGFSIQILDQTRAKVNQIEMVGRVRFGGRVVEPWRLKIGKSNNS